MCFTLQVNSEPNQQVPKINKETATFYHISQQDIEFSGKYYRLFIAAPKIIVQPLSVLYLLDGNAHFPLALNSVKTDRTLPLIVGIGYPDSRAYSIVRRTKDYTPPAIGLEFQQGGEAEGFLQFIRSQVKPTIEAKYAIDHAQQYFFGHSFGGLFGLYILFNQPELFQYYTIASPSLWWGDGVIIPRHKPWINHSPHAIWVTLGEYEERPEEDPQMTNERLNKIKRRQRILSTRKLADELAQQGQPVTFELLPRANHGAAILPAIQQTLGRMQHSQP